MRIERIRRGSERGSILLHVMVTGVLIALIAASLLRMMMLRYQMSYRSQKILQEKRDDQAALAEVIARWNANGTANATCSGPPPGWTGCLNGAAPPNNCNCTCTRPASAGPPTVNKVTVSAALAGGQCALTIASDDL